MGDTITKNDLEALCAAGLIDDAKLAEITAFLKTRHTGADIQQPRFDLTHVLWYAGALIIIGAMGLFTTDAFNRMGGWALAACGAVYAIVAAAAGHYLWSTKNLRVPGGLLLAVAVFMVPMIVYGIQDALDLWKYAQGDPGEYKNVFPYIHGSWLYMEIATMITAFAVVSRYKFSFILLIAAVVGWFMSMDLAMWFTGDPNNYWDHSTRRTVSIVYGLAMMAVAWIMDVRNRSESDLPFWLHIFGALTFWGGLSWSDGGTAFEKFLYCAICISLIAFSLFMNRRVYSVFGALGVSIYLGYLANDVFDDMIGFSFALSAIGLGIIFLGLYLHRNRDRLAAGMDALLPSAISQLRPHHARRL